MTSAQLPRNNLCHLTRDAQHPQPWQNSRMAFPGQRSEPAGCAEVNKPWRRAVEGSHWTELLVHNTTAPQWGKEQPQSAGKAFSHGVAFSCSGFPPKPSFQDFFRDWTGTLPQPQKRSVNNLWIVWFSLQSSLVNKENSWKPSSNVINMWFLNYICI